MLPRRFCILSGLAFLVLAGMLLLDAFHPFAYVRLRNLYRDAISRAGRKAPPNPNLVFLAIDGASIHLDKKDIEEVFGLTDDSSDDSCALHLMTQGFPWSREVYALALQKLVGAGAKVVVFDTTFPSAEKDDAVFRSALDRYADRVVVGNNFVGQGLTKPSETLITQGSPSDSRMGFTNFWSDNDDVVRRARYQVTLQQVRESEANPGAVRFESLASTALIKAGFADRVPVDPEDSILRFTAPPREGFPAHSLYKIFVPAFWKQNYGSGEFFRDKIVVVGTEGKRHHAEQLTPLGRMADAELHLNAINAAIGEEFIRELPVPMKMMLTVLAGVIATATSLVVRSHWLRVAALLIYLASAIGLTVLCFNYDGFYLPMVPVLGNLTLTMLLGVACDLTAQRLENARIRGALKPYVSPDLETEKLSIDPPPMVSLPAGLMDRSRSCPPTPELVRR